MLSLVSVVLVVGAMRLESQQVMSAAARTYLNTAFDLLEKNAPFRRAVHWRDSRPGWSPAQASATSDVSTADPRLSAKDLTFIRSDP